MNSAKKDFYIKAFSNAKSSRNIWSTFKQYKNGNSEVSASSIVVPANLNMSLPEYMAFYFKDKIARIRESIPLIKGDPKRLTHRMMHDKGDINPFELSIPTIFNTQN